MSVLVNIKKYPIFFNLSGKIEGRLCKESLIKWNKNNKDFKMYSLSELYYWTKRDRKYWKKDTKCYCGNRINFNKCTGKYLLYCSKSCSTKSSEVQNKMKSTCIKRFGYDNIFRNYSYLKECYKKKLGVEHPLKSNKVKQKVKNTLLNKYGVDHNSKISFVKKSKESKLKKSIYLSNLSKSINKSFNKSTQEDICFNLFCEYFGKSNVIRQYQSIEYPFNCDFYLPKFKLYIEFNGSWTHGNVFYKGKWVGPYNGRTKLHKDRLKYLKNKSKKSKFYKNSLYVWTNLDVRKRKIAKKNNLRFIEFWNIEEVVNWCSKFKSYKRFSINMLRENIC